MHELCTTLDNFWDVLKEFHRLPKSAALSFLAEARSFHNSTVIENREFWYEFCCDFSAPAQIWDKCSQNNSDHDRKYE